MKIFLVTVLALSMILAAAGCAFQNSSLATIFSNLYKSGIKFHRTVICSRENVRYFHSTFEFT
jgi:hypothetical protein